MTWGEILLISSGFLVLVSSVVMVLVRRRSELTAERTTAALLDRAASTIDQLHAELLSTRSPHATDNLGSVVELRVRDLHEEPRGDHDEARHHLLLYTLASRSVPVDHNVVDLWAHYTREAEGGDSYRDLLGPAFDDAIYHAAKVGVLNRDQADSLVVWATATAAIERHGGSKSHLQARVPRGSHAYV